MRDYSKVSAQFWTGKTGRSLRGDMQTQIVALYLMTSPHANMIGVFNCPAIYIAHETGSSLEGALEGLNKLSEGGFCTYDKDSETVWVHEMAKFQIGDSLKSSDNRVKDIQKQYENLPEGQIKQGFYAKYHDAYHLPESMEYDSPLQAPCKPLSSQKQEQKQEQNIKALVPDDVVDDSTGKKSDDCPHAQIIEAYHEILPSLPRVAVWTEKRKSMLRSRWREDPKRQSVDWWKRLFKYIGDSDFLTGKAEPRKDAAPFSADLEWIVGSSNLVKIIEGKYHA